jgi:hypothetical protein
MARAEESAETVWNPETGRESVRIGLHILTGLCLDIPALGVEPGHQGAVVGLC